MFRIEKSRDVIEQEAIQRRKVLDEERKKRIFDPKNLKFGIDVKALEEQIQIKQQKAKQEEEREKCYDRETLRILHVLENKEHEQALRQSQLQSELNQFRSENQKKHLRREFDLNDPQALQKDHPARQGNEDKGLGVSSLQIFFGEDLGASARVKQQKQQMRQWILEKATEDRERERREAEEKHLHDLRQKELDDLRLQLEVNEQEYRMRQAKLILQENQRLALERKQRQFFDEDKEEKANELEIETQVTGDFLTENPDQAISALGPNRIRVDSFKGMRPEQKSAIYQYQLYQREQNKLRKQHEAAEKKGYEREQARIAARISQLEHEKELRDKQKLDQLVKDNHRISSETKQRLNTLDKVVYTNVPNDSYYKQFNTTSR